MFGQSKINEYAEVSYEQQLQVVASNFQGNTINSLYWNANANNVAQVIEKLEAGVDVNGQIENGNTALHAAVFNRDLPLVKLLLEKYSANPNIANNCGQTAYDLALLHDYLNKDPDAQKRCSVMKWTCDPLPNSIEIIGLLHRHGALPNKIAMVRKGVIYENAITQWESNQDKSNSLKKYKGSKLSEYKEVRTMHSSFFPKEPICQYTEVQANATAKWWLKTLENDVPKIIALMNHEKKESIQLTQEQKEIFVKTLTDLIWLECQKPERQIGGTYLRIDYNGQNWDLIQKAMKKANFTIKNDAMIQQGIMTVIKQNGKVTFQNGSKIGDVYNPDNKPLGIIENYQPSKLGQNR